MADPRITQILEALNRVVAVHGGTIAYPRDSVEAAVVRDALAAARSLQAATPAQQAVRVPLTDKAAITLFYRAQDRHPATDMVSFLRGIEAAEAAHEIALPPAAKEAR
jgi:hypothetical protein